MKNNTSLIVRKENIFQKIINKIKNIFYKKEEIYNKEEIIIPKTIEESKKEFLDKIKVSIDTEINVLKIKLDNGEIKAIDLTDEQIDKLQKIYDEEIEKKKKILQKIKKY